ncbi:MAG: hypothetical protein RJB31_1045, partial [Bacteroidota bacterium]
MTTANNITSHIRGPLSLNGGTLASGTPTTLYGSWALYGDVTATGTTISTISASDVFLDGTRTFTVSDAAKVEPRLLAPVAKRQVPVPVKPAKNAPRRAAALQSAAPKLA